MKLDEMLNNVSQHIPSVDESLKNKIYSQTIMKTNQTKVYFFSNLRLVLVVLFLSLIIGVSMMLYNKKPFEKTNFDIIVYSKTDDGYQFERLSNENVTILGEYTYPMNTFPGLPITLSFNNSLIEISVDNGQFVLWHDYIITQGDNNNAILTPIKGEKSGLENVGKNYSINSSSTIYSVPYNSDNIYTSATINYKIIQNNKAIFTGKIIITNNNGIYTATLKRN